MASNSSSFANGCFRLLCLTLLSRIRRDFGQSRIGDGKRGNSRIDGITDVTEESGESGQTRRLPTWVHACVENVTPKVKDGLEGGKGAGGGEKADEIEVRGEGHDVGGGNRDFFGQFLHARNRLEKNGCLE